VSTNNVSLAILQDPVMQSILNQAKNDPAALQNHMQNATIRMKIQKVSIF
jgi:stress-induced-phosphoprotein 1